MTVDEEPIALEPISSFLEHQYIHERYVIELLRKVKSLALDLFHDVVTVQADVMANFIWVGGRVWTVAIVVYDKKPPAGLESPPHALHCCVRIVEVMIRVEENCPVESVCGQLRIALRAKHWMHVLPSLGGNSFANLVKELRIDIDGEDRAAVADPFEDVGQKMANTRSDVGDCVTGVQTQRINQLVRLLDIPPHGGIHLRGGPCAQGGRTILLVGSGGNLRR